MQSFATIRAQLSGSELGYLRVLTEREREESGWQRSGVRGWLTVQEIRAAAKASPVDAAPSLVQRGLADVVILKELTCTRRLYRTTDLGAAVIDDLVGRPHRPVAAPSPPTGLDSARFPLPIDAWSAILGLRWVSLKLELPRRRTAGWYRTTEIRQAYPSDCAWAPFSTSDLQWLRDRGFARQRHAPIPARPRKPVSEWRLSALGERVRVVEEAWGPPHFDPRNHWLDAQLLDTPGELDLAAEIALTQELRRARVTHHIPTERLHLAAIAPRLGFPHEMVL
jgi:hypothetical protein